MDFQDTEQEAAYRAQVRGWLADNAAPFTLPRDGSLPHDEFVRRARGWQARKADAGYVGILWPTAVGGQGGTPMQQVIFHQEEEHYRLPTVPFAVGVGMCLPTLFTAAPELAATLVPPGMRGEQIWCQLFSEPSAGSDLAAARTRAVRDGDDWVISGQKVWTSYAHESDYGLLLARTDPAKPKHKGMTMFFIDMHAPGVEVRPIRTLYGDAEFNEVFLTDLRIPDSQRLGAVNDGWKVSLTTLMFERMAVGGKPAGASGVRDLVALAQGQGEDPRDHADAIARFYVADEGIALTRMRSMTAVSRGSVPGPEASINKLVMAKVLQDMAGYAQEVAGNRAIDNGARAPLREFNYWQMWSAGLRIAGGTDEILRNILAERVLGLPPEPRNDRDTPFSELAK